MTGTEIAAAVLIHGPKVVTAFAELMEIGDREITLEEIQDLRDSLRTYDEIIAEARKRATHSPV
jgi:hypothetical protein